MENDNISDLSNKSMDILSFAIDNIRESTYLIDDHGKFHYVNIKACQTLGYSRDEILKMTIFDMNPYYTQETWLTQWKDIKEKNSKIFEGYNRSKYGVLIPVEINANFFIYDNQEYILALIRDITRLKENESKNQIYFNFLAKMDRINQIIQSTNELEQIMDKILDELLLLFKSDRALLLNELNYNNESWSIPNIRCQKDFSLPFHNKPNFLVESDLNNLFKSILNSKIPITINTKNASSNFHNMEPFLDVKSAITMSLFPKIGNPWILCLQQCSKERVWTIEEQQTFELIGRRIDDALSSLLFYKNVRLAEVKYRKILETSNEAILILDVNGKPTFINRKFIDLLGYEENEFKNTYITDFMFEEDLTDFDLKIRNRKLFIAENFERRFRKKDGSVIWCYFSSSPILNDAGEYEGSLSMFSDITDRKKAEIEILKLNRIYRTLSECNESLVLEKNEHDLLDKICEIVVERGGYKLAWVGYAQNDEEKTVKVVSSKGAVSYLNDIKISWEDNKYGNGPTGKAIRLNEVQVSNYQEDENFNVWRKSANEHGFVSGAAFPLTIDNKTSGAISIYSGAENPFDQKELRLLNDLAFDLAYGISSIHARNEIQKLNQTLEERVKERTNQLEKLNDDLSAFSYTVSHDLRTPLTHVSGYVELLKDILKSNENKITNDYFNKIEISINEMNQLIDSILAFSNMENKELSLKTVNLSQLIQKVIKGFEPDIQDRKIEWKVDNIPNVLGDENLLQIVIVNLISNALKFTKNNTETKIKIGSSSNDTENIIFVQDNGVGFDIRNKDRLFGAFQRLHSRSEFEGYGIGLSSVRRIIEGHGGHVWAESTYEQGTIFYFSLPINKD